MNIGFDAKRAYLNRSGLGNYSRNLLKSLIEYYPENNYTAFTPVIESTRFHNYLISKDNVKVISPGESTSHVFHPIWRRFIIPKYFLKQNLDIYHGLSAELPAKLIGKKIKKIVTIHDLIYLRFPHLYAAVDSYIYDKKAKQACNDADIVIAISEQTKSDLIEFYKVPEEKIKVEYQSCDPIFYNTNTKEENEAIRTIYKLPENFILFVGTIEERKNLMQLVKAINNLAQFNDFQLVVVGKKKKHFDEIQRFISYNKMNTQVLFFDSIPSNILPIFYQLASLFVYPSLFEGFGIPIIEAAYSKVPIITSIDSCFEEAGGPSTIYVNPNNSDELGNAIEKVLADKNLQQSMIENTFQYVSKFKDDITASSMIKLYKSIL